MQSPCLADGPVEATGNFLKSKNSIIIPLTVIKAEGVVASQGVPGLGPIDNPHWEIRVGFRPGIKVSRNWDSLVDID